MLNDYNPINLSGIFTFCTPIRNTRPFSLIWNIKPQQFESPNQTLTEESYLTEFF